MLEVGENDFRAPLFQDSTAMYLQNKSILMLDGKKIPLGETVTIGGYSVLTAPLEFAHEGDLACLTKWGVAIDVNARKHS